MSVLVRDPENGRIYVFIKGAPERIERNSISKPSNFAAVVESLSLSGFRTIAIGYKDVDPEELEKYMKADRELYEEEVKVLGLVAFENKVKSEAREAMQRLRESNIDMKIITGDNIYIAVETALRSGILLENYEVILLEGKKQSWEKEGKKTYEGIILSKTSTLIKQEKVTLSES